MDPLLQFSQPHSSSALQEEVRQLLKQGLHESAQVLGEFLISQYRASQLAPGNADYPSDKADGFVLFADALYANGEYHRAIWYYQQAIILVQLVQQQSQKIQQQVKPLQPSQATQNSQVDLVKSKKLQQSKINSKSNNNEIGLLALISSSENGNSKKNVEVFGSSPVNHQVPVKQPFQDVNRISSTQSEYAASLSHFNRNFASSNSEQIYTVSSPTLMTNLEPQTPQHTRSFIPEPFTPTQDRVYANDKMHAYEPQTPKQNSKSNFEPLTPQQDPQKCSGRASSKVADSSSKIKPVNEAEVRLKIARCYLKQGYIKQALSELECLNQQERSASILCFMGRLYRQVNRVKQAVHCYKECLKKCPMAIEAVLALADMKVPLKDIKQFYPGKNQTDKQQLNQISEDNKPSLENAQTHNQNQKDISKQQIENSIKNNERQTPEWFSDLVSGHSQIAAQHYSSAQKSLTQILNSKEGFRDCLHVQVKIAECLHSMGQEQAALRTLQHVRNVDIRFTEGMDMLAIILQSQLESTGDNIYREMLSQLVQQLTQADPTRAETYVAKALYFYNQKDLQAAEQTIDKGLTENPYNFWLHIVNGKFKIKCGLHEKAAESYRKALGVGGDRVDCQLYAFQGLVECAFMLRKFQDAILIAKQLVQKMPDNPKAYVLLGSTYIINARVNIHAGKLDDLKLEQAAHVFQIACDLNKPGDNFAVGGVVVAKVLQHVVQQQQQQNATIDREQQRVGVGVERNEAFGYKEEGGVGIGGLVKLGVENEEALGQQEGRIGIGGQVKDGDQPSLSPTNNLRHIHEAIRAIRQYLEVEMHKEMVASLGILEAYCENYLQATQFFNLALGMEPENEVAVGGMAAMGQVLCGKPKSILLEILVRNRAFDAQEQEKDMDTDDH
eukprot:TRINITY_DN8930_c0_g2_i2.p1 TRINITY_DN8930_c0_g2~~TRINITY_DN8930_c0_g2_i2.p1  ORF type:complete len:946 (-),score=123.49 TRINITY_DN8930_c0_g2_i2:1335-4028(-)